MKNQQELKHLFLNHFKLYIPLLVAKNILMLQQVTLKLGRYNIPSPSQKLYNEEYLDFFAIINFF